MFPSAAHANTRSFTTATGAPRRWRILQYFTTAPARPARRASCATSSPRAMTSRPRTASANRMSEVSRPFRPDAIYPPPPPRRRPLAVAAAPDTAGIAGAFAAAIPNAATGTAKSFTACFRTPAAPAVAPLVSALWNAPRRCERVARAHAAEIQMLTVQGPSAPTTLFDLFKENPRGPIMVRAAPNLCKLW